MRILAIDPSSRSGFAIGIAGEIPRSGTIRLKKPDEPLDVAFVNFAAWLRDQFVLDLPELVAIEHFLSPKYSSSQNSAILALGLYGIARALAGLYEIRFESPTADEVRKFCCGRAHALPARKPGSAPRTEKQKAEARKATKDMVVQRARVLGLVPRNCTDDNRCDAALIHYYAGCKFARQSPRELVLFNQVAR